jgi:Family of unknown function (DUF6412)
VTLPRTLTAALVPLLVLWQLVVHSAVAPLGPSAGAPSGMLALATVVLTGLALAFLAHSARIATAVTTRPLTGLASALREKSKGARFQRQLNPDAAGHTRPRAPGAVPAAA